ncbi:MAG TPA: N-6 DNA methylase [Rhodoferax sp.]|nr:N-6 DNA methylase [Rhodoferax sp.]
MLDSETKRRIDACRDILVGKVPDPKSQVEQITIALIYKFMDDMDAEAEELGGKRSFFAGSYARFGWAHLLAPGLGGFEVLALYSEAIASMRQNPGLPELFRDIFKNAYLPYRDPETLKSFLKEINVFTYDHSEKLGDAFEYLLSVLGSQGDAGQFRTPRHIIDFMVTVLDPKKNETILDPACGTAGFLISAWKHILAANTPANDVATEQASHSENNSYSGNQDGGYKLKSLTPDERIRLAANIRGYDISPDMVRLSLVNLYLHGFSDPHVVEYDTLTSDEKWNEVFDVILANPPFMSPKGGIKPHKRFSVKASRSEVLFVDYMAEHLTATGRAAIVVPEGIIFQSGTAYKALRKMLVDTSLVAVVSLPAGVFNPYSGVKTSILILDKRVHKQTDKVLFVKVQNDGFNLGAQRRAVMDSHLPEATRLLRGWMVAPGKLEGDGVMAQAVARERIGLSGDLNLSGERYVVASAQAHAWPVVMLGEIVDELESGVSVNSENRNVVGDELGILKTSCVTTGIFDPQEHKAVLPEELPRVRCPVRKNSIIISRMNTEALVGANAYVDKDFDHLYLPDRLWQTVITRPDVDVRFVQFILASKECREIISSKCGGTSGSMKNIAKPQLLSLQIPLPPREVQHQIVAEIEGYQKIIDGARQVLDNYQPGIVVQANWPLVELGKLCSVGGTITTDVDLSLPYFGADSIESNSGRLLKTETAQSQRVNGPVYEFSGERLRYSKIRPYLNKLTIVDLCGYCSSDMYPLVPASSQIEIQYLATYMLSKVFNDGIRGHYERASIPKINRAQLFAAAIPLPDLETQRTIVAEIEAEQALVAANRELIRRFEAKIKTTIDRVWSAS